MQSLDKQQARAIVETVQDHAYTLAWCHSNPRDTADELREAVESKLGIQLTSEQAAALYQLVRDGAA